MQATAQFMFKATQAQGRTRPMGRWTLVNARILSA